jgi:hypothetical protein
MSDFAQNGGSADEQKFQLDTPAPVTAATAGLSSSAAVGESAISPSGSAKVRASAI